MEYPTPSANAAIAQYVEGLDNQLPLPVTVDLPAACEHEINAATIRAATEVSSLLGRYGIDRVVLGSVSTQRHLGEVYAGRPLHDVDFAIRQEDVEPAKQALRAAGFTAWNEREILATVRNSGGGFGRVHNEGAAADRYVNLATGLPIWFGFFGYEQNERGTAFHEYYTVSRAKVESAVEWLQEQDITASTKAALDALTPLPFDIAVFDQLEQAFALEGVSLWSILFKNDINQRDTQRRRSMPAEQPDELFEIKLTKQFAVSALQYFRTQKIDTGGIALPVFSLEGGYMHMDRYFPHYLGPRDKYAASRDTIRRSGLLDAGAVRAYEQIFAERFLTHTPTRTIDFTLDKIQDADTLRRQPTVASVKNDEIFYPALLFENIHLERRQPNA